MLIFNGKKYAKNESELLDSLFQSDGTCNGYYKKTKGGIKLFKLSNGKPELEAFIKASNTGGFVVTAHTVSGKPRYLFSTCSSTEQWLGIESLGYMATKEACALALESVI